MKEYIPPKQIINISEEELKLKIEKASQAGMRLENFHEKMDEFRKLRDEIIKGLDKDKEKRYQLLNKEITDAEVLVPSIIEFKKVLELLNLPKERIEQILNHENAHANKAEQLETKNFIGFRIRFHVDKNGEIAFSKSAKILSNNNFSKKQILEEDILVAEAPLHYGDRPSNRDKKMIDERMAELDILNQE